MNEENILSAFANDYRSFTTIQPVSDCRSSQPTSADMADVGSTILVTCSAIAIVFAVRKTLRSLEFTRQRNAFKRMPVVVRVAFVSLMVAVIAYGGTKPGTNYLQTFSRPLAALMSSGEQLESIPEAVSLTENQQLAGFALTAVVTNETFDLSAPSNAVIHANWLKRGAAEDGFWAPVGVFCLGTNRFESVYVSSSGTLSFNRPKSSPTARPMPDGSSIAFLAPLQTVLGIPPESRWNLLSATNSLFWHDVTDSGSVRFTWQNALLGRETNAPLSFQAELFPDGDFIYRYDLSGLATCDLRLAGTNFVVGAQNNGGGETALISANGFHCAATNHLCASLYSLDGTNVVTTPLCSVATNSTKFSLHWTALGDYNPSDPDPDDDGINTSDEVLLYHTDPNMPDSDLDGISDGDEIASGTNPLNPDSDNDGIPDGLDSQPFVWNDASADSDGDGLSLAEELLYGLDPAVGNNVDTDGDGWEDWKEVLAGTSPTDYGDNPWNGDGSAKIFDVTFTLESSSGTPLLIAVGGYRMVFGASGTSRTLTLREGIAHPVALYVPTAYSADITAVIDSDFAVFQNPHPAFNGGGTLSGGRTASSGMIAQPVPSTDPERICFHSTSDKQVEALVSPDMPGNWSWGLGCEPWGGTESEVNLSYDDSPTWIIFHFLANGAASSRSIWRDITRCTLLEEHPEWLTEGQGEPRWDPPYDHYHEGDPVNGEPIQYVLESEEAGAWPGLLAPVNNDDDDASASEDSTDRLMRIGDGDLVAYYPLGRFNGNCCPCPEHQAVYALSGAFDTPSGRIALWADSGKTNAFTGTAYAGVPVYLEGLSPCLEIGTEKLVVSYSDENGQHAVTNACTVLSQRIFPDIDGDDDVDEADKALCPSLDRAYGWVIPANSNMMRQVQLRTDVALPGIHVLTLSGGSGFRVWQTSAPSTNDVPLLVGGQSVTNGVDGVTWEIDDIDTVHLEAVGSGAATLTYAFIGTGTASRVVSRASLRLTAVAIDSIELVGAPEDGLVALNGSQVVMKANILPANHPIPEDEPKWFYQQLSSDGTWGNWIQFGGLAQGTNYVHETTQSGIFRVKAILTIEQEPFGERVYERTTDELFGPGTAGTPDAFGVVDTQTQIAIRNAAKGFLGSTAYSLNGVVPAEYGFPEYSNPSWKCNIFVAHRAVQAGADVPAINGLPASYPPTANEWAGTEDTHPFVAGFQNDIENWTLMTNPTYPQPGFIVGHPATSGSGHCGIVDYDGAGIAAGTETVNKNYLLFLDGTSGFRKYEP